MLGFIIVEKNIVNKIMYKLPELPYQYSGLEPYVSEEQLKIHHQKHHQAYVNGANAIFEKLDNARRENGDIDAKSILKELSFHVSGYTLHNLFWQNLIPAKDKAEIGDKLSKKVEEDFGSFDRFKKEFSQAASSVEGSGWAALVLDDESKKLLIMQVEKHNLNTYANSRILLVLDVWEHAYYIDYKNDRAKFIDNFWNIINWKEVERRLGEAM